MAADYDDDNNDDNEAQDLGDCNDNCLTLCRLFCHSSGHA